MRRIILATCSALLVLAPVVALAQNRNPPAGSSTVGSASPRGDAGGASSSSSGSSGGSSSTAGSISSGGMSGGSYSSPVSSSGSSMRSNYDGPRSGDVSARPRNGGVNVGQAVPASERPRGDTPVLGRAITRAEMNAINADKRGTGGGLGNGFDTGRSPYYGSWELPYYGYWPGYAGYYGWNPYYGGMWDWTYGPGGMFWPMSPMSMMRDYAAYWYGYDTYANMPPAYTEGTKGSVKLRVTPKNAEVYVDGTFFGEVDNYDGTFQHLDLRAGTHTIEIRASGYETTKVDIRVLPGRTVTYKGELKAVGK